jgi:hypothetical protein
MQRRTSRMQAYGVLSKSNPIDVRDAMMYNTNTRTVRGFKF